MDTHILLAELMNPENAYPYKTLKFQNMNLFNDVEDYFSPDWFTNQ